MRLIEHRSFKWLPHAFIAGGILLLGVVVVLSQAAPVQASPTQLPQLVAELSAADDNAACLACHGQTGQMGKLPNGTALPITTLKDLFNVSTHGVLACTKCHVGIKETPPHRDLKALKIETERDYAISYKESCKDCHTNQYNQVQDSMHTKLRVEQGNLNSPVCNDCHNPHTETRHKDAQGVLLPQARVDIPKTCAKCHDSIYKAYADSVHGKGVLSANNPDVPTCTDCHGVHTITDARTAAFRNSSIELCAKCHTDAKLMGKYKISTEVMNTYVADFHGTTVTLFERLTPDQPTNKPVCYDCHGVHNILRAEDPQKGLQVRSNLHKTCLRCHPDITEDFESSWLSHYIPSPTKYPLVYYVTLIYNILIPVVLGGMALIIATDIYHKVRTRGKTAHKTTESTQASGNKPGDPTTGKKE